MMATAVNWRQAGHWLPEDSASGPPQRWQGARVMRENVAPPRHPSVTPRRDHREGKAAGGGELGRAVLRIMLRLAPGELPLLRKRAPYGIPDEAERLEAGAPVLA
jgi:hypothetical protein